jgi:ankyrin repeat protein
MKNLMLFSLAVAAMAGSCVSGGAPEKPVAEVPAPAVHPIFAQVSRGDLAALEAFLKEGGNPDLRDRRSWPLLQIAAERNRPEAVLMLLAAKADVNLFDSDHRTALMKSSYFGYTEIVKILLDARADYIPADNLGETALKKSIYRKHPDVEKLLREAGAEK